MRDSTRIAIRLRETMGKDTAADLIRKTGSNISKQSVSAYLTGKRIPKTPFLKDVADTYDVNLAWLIGDDAPKHEQDDEDENIIILSRAAKRMTPGNRRRLVEVARLMFEDAFDDD